MTVSTLVILFVALIGAGALARPIGRALRLPDSLVLAAIGIALGLAASLAGGAGGGTAPGSLAALLPGLAAGSDLFLYVFLPVLIFQSALGVDMRRVREDIAPILVLAIVAVLVATFGIGLALAPIAGVPVAACFLVAAIVATTDPVAVIGIFRDVGAPERLTRLVEGESLFNDAVAITLFLVFLTAITEPGTQGAWRVAADFVVLPLGGALLGALAGAGFVAAAARMAEERAGLVSLSLAVPFACFWAAETLFHVSGVIALVSAGVTLASLAPGRIPAGAVRYLRDIWDQLASVAAVLVFILSALLVPRLLAGATPFDAVLLLVTVLAALAARAIVMFPGFRLLARLGLHPPVPRSFRLVALWGGLRGSMTLVLALAVTENPAVPPEIARLVAVLATGFTLATLFLQGATLRPLIRGLGLDRLTALDEALRDLGQRAARERVAGVKTRMRDRLREARRADAAPPAGDGAAAPLAEDERERLAVGLVALAGFERECVLRHFSEAILSPRTARRLADEARARGDRVRAEGAAAPEREGDEALPLLVSDRLALWLQRRAGIAAPLAARLAGRFEALVETEIVAGEARHFVEAEIAPVLGPGVAARLAGRLDARRRAAEREILAVHRQYPAFAAALEDRAVARTGRAAEAAEVSRLRAAGLLSEEAERHWRAALAEAGRRETRLRLDLGLDRATLVAASPLFAELPEGERARLARHLTPFFASPGERVIRRGEIGDAAYFVSSGALEVDTGASQVPLGSGDVFGEIALLHDVPRQADVVSLGYSTLLRLERRAFARVLDAHPPLRRRVEAEARRRLGEDAARALPEPAR